MQSTTLKGFPLSFQQKRIWRWSQVRQLYRSQCAVKLEGPLDPLKFHQAVQQVAEHYEIFHTTFYMAPGMDLPMQVLHNKSVISFLFVDSEHLEDEKQHLVLEEQWRGFQDQRFDLEHGPQLHIVLIRTSGECHTLLISLPALCADAFTLQQLIPMLLQAYEACSMGKTLSIDEDELQYIDVSSWQDDLLQDEEREQQQAFWHKMELSRLTDMSLPFQTRRERQMRSQSEEGTRALQPQQVEIALDAGLQRQLLALSQQSQVSPEACLLAIWQILLWRLTDESPLIGLLCNGRPHEELAAVPGPSAWTIPFALNTPFSKHLTFEFVLKQTQQVLQEAAEKQLYFNWEDLDPERAQEEQIFPLSFAYTAWPEQWQQGSLQASLLRQSHGSEPLQLQLHITQIGERLHIQLLSQPSVFSLPEARRLAGLFSTLLLHTLAAPGVPIDSLPLLTLEEQTRQQERMRGQRSDWPFVPLHQRFQAQAQHWPNASAVRCGEVLLSYQEVEQSANQLAHLLLAYGLRPGERVALYQRRDHRAIISLLAVLKAGGCYVPLDEDLPAARVRLLLQELAPALLLCNQELEERVGKSPVPMLLVERWPELLREQPTVAPLIQVRSEDLAYVMLTSGSTGVPKGVEIRQGSVSNYIQAMCELLEVEAGWHFATVSSLAADLGNTSIFCGLASGGCVHVLPYTLVTDGTALARYVEQFPLDVLKIVPSHLQTLLVAAGGSVLPGKKLILGGEALPWLLVQQMQQYGATCQLYNHYGPTEATIGALVNSLGPISQIPMPVQEEWGSSVPLGRPISNMQFSIRDRQGQRVPPGVSAELYLAGAGLAAGYLGSRELARERFVDVEEAGGKQRWYRTGDVVREFEHGQVEFMGRQDSQVKLRGYRIELTEVEAYLRKHSAVRDAVVELREGQLVGYIVPWKEPGPSQQEVREALLAEVPAYLVPGRILHLERLPLTANGKVDRRHLPASAQEEEKEPVQRSEEGRTPTEEVILGIWRQVLGIKEIRRNENFFQLGGHSLLGTRVIARMRTVFGIDVPITWLFDVPTVAGLSTRIEEAFRQGQGKEMPPLVPVARTQGLPLSFAQQRLWFLDQLEPGNTTYNIPRAVRLRGMLERAALERALYAVIQRHENLRTVFPVYEEQPVQQIAPQPLTRLVLLDLSALDQQAREREARRLAQQEAQRPFDLARGPLLRCWLLQLVEQEDQVLLLTMHHIISDGWSSGILVRELSSLYIAFSQEQAISLPPLPVQYADYALWQRSWLQGEVLARQLDYWKRQLDGLIPLELPNDHPRPAIQTFRGGLQHLLLPLQLNQQLQELSQREGVTLFMTLLTAFQVLLLRYSGQWDIAVGTPIANRTREETEGLIGFFVNTLVLRSDLSGNPTFVNLLTRVRRMALEAYAHQDVPFEQVVEAVHPQRDLSRAPLFQVFFELQNRSEGEKILEPPQVQMEGFSIEQHTAKFEMSMVVSEDRQGLHTALEYNTDLFDASTIRRLLGHFQVLLEALVANPTRQIEELPLLTEKEWEQQLVEWNATAHPYQQDQCIHQLFDRQAERTPEAIALVCEQQQLSYGELNRRANQLAHYLIAQGVGLEVLVGLCMERSVEMVVALLAILKAGGAYVPLDPGYPAERLAFMLHEAQVAVLLTQQSLLSSLAEATTACMLCLDTQWSQVIDFPVSPPATLATSDNLMYVIYTSGSTGHPKGAGVYQRNFVNLLSWLVPTFTFAPSDRVLIFTSLSFDLTQKNIFMPLISGGTIHFNPPGPFDPRALLGLIAAQHITFINCTPSAFYALADEAAEDTAANQLASLRSVFLGGEPVVMGRLARWIEAKQPATEFVNTYGPTECTDLTTTYRTRTPEQFIDEPMPLGSPVANVQLYLLDAHLQPVPIGVLGELSIGGESLGCGYLHQPLLTAERFVPNPFGKQPGTRLYRTGDLARYAADGTLEFVGRLDQQIKLRGYRIELGEIEELLGQHPQVKQCVTLLQRTETQEERLVAYIEVEKDIPMIPAETWGQYLRDKLPTYMIPDHFVLLEEFPLTPNGKVNRKALPTPAWTDRKKEEIGEKRLLSLVEELVLQVWMQILHREQIGLQENFFEIGGHSLLATQVVARLRRMLNTEIPLILLFETPTISRLAARLQQQIQQGQGLEFPPIVPVPRDQDLPLSFAQQRLWFLHQLAPQSTAYNIPMAVRLQGHLQVAALHASLQAVVHRHESLRTHFEEQDGLVLQRIAGELPLCFPLIDLSACSAEQREAAVQRLVEAESQQTFDLRCGPLLRSWLLRVAAQEHVLLLTMHHIVCDGWSMGILVRELTQLYQDRLAGQPSSLPALPIQYADYASWQRSWLQGEVLAEHLRYWTRQLSRATALQVPGDFPRAPGQIQRGAQFACAMEAGLADGLRRLSQQEGVTLFMTLLAAWQVLLARLSGQQDLVIGTDSANRSHLETEGLIGFFVNVLALRVNLQDQPSFQQLLQRVREMVLGAYAHQELPFEMLVEHLRLPREGRRTPLVNVLFVMQNVPLGEADLPDLLIRPVEQEIEHAKFDLACFVSESSEGLYCSLKYDAGLFKQETIAILAQRFETLLRSIVEQPYAKIVSLEISTESERTQKAKQQATLRQNLKMSRGERLSIPGEERHRPSKG